MDTNLNIFKDKGKYMLWVQHHGVELTQEQLDNLYNLIKHHASFTNESELK